MGPNDRPTSAIPEVQEFEKARRELEDFKASNVDFFEALGALVDRYNSTYDMASKAVKAKQVSCGPFVLTGRPTVKWDAEKLYEEMGRDFFLEHGGVEKQVVVREIDKSKVEAAYVQKLIPEEVADVARKVRVAHHSPDKVVLP
jgi:hypothetical protein